MAWLMARLMEGGTLLYAGMEPKGRKLFTKMLPQTRSMGWRLTLHKWLKKWLKKFQVYWGVHAEEFVSAANGKAALNATDLVQMNMRWNDP